MTGLFDRIVENAHRGQGPCHGCPAQEVHEGRYVNPGLLNHDAEIAFMTLDPSHDISWNRYDSWRAYNEEFSSKFKTWRGGKKISELIEPLGLGLDDVWLGDSVKCPVDNARFRFEDPADVEAAFDHCQSYLKEELGVVNPRVIVTLGADTTERILELLFDMTVGALKTGTTDCGRVFDTKPPVVVSPHWSHGWLDRSPSGTRNLHIVQQALVETYEQG